MNIGTNPKKSAPRKAIVPPNNTMIPATIASILLIIVEKSSEW
jgi:hypothetical protein